MRNLALLLTCLVPALSAQVSSSETDRPSVRVHGESQVSAEPDEAQIDIGVVTQGATTEGATNENSRRVTAVVASLHALFPSALIKTVNFSVNPNFRYPKEGSPTVAGYTASDTVRLVLDDIGMLRNAISTALKAGASSANRLNFTLKSKSEKDVRAKALGEAASQAASSAEALAASLNLKLGRVLRVEEGQPVIVSPAPQIDLGSAQSSDTTPLSAGYIQVHANVNLTYELLQ